MPPPSASVSPSLAVDGTEQCGGQTLSVTVDRSPEDRAAGESLRCLRRVFAEAVDVTTNRDVLDFRIDYASSSIEISKKDGTGGKVTAATLQNAGTPVETIIFSPNLGFEDDMSSAFGVIKSFQTYRVTDMTHSSARANGDEQTRVSARAISTSTLRG